jgi:hypothetical protein
VLFHRFLFFLAPHDHSTDSVNLPIINQSPSFDVASWNSSTNIVLSSILSHICQHENELKHYFIKCKTYIHVVHFLENTAHYKKLSYIKRWECNICLMLLCCIVDVYLSFLFYFVSDPTSRRFIRWLHFQTFIYKYIYIYVYGQCIV